MSAGDTSAESAERATLRVMRGDPTPEELAALVAVLVSAAGGEQVSGPPAPVSQWAPPARLTRPAVAPTGWWESSLPR